MGQKAKTLPITMEDIYAAQARLRGYAVRTPLIENAALNERAGGRVLVKPECLQITGSFKFRGAYNRLSQLNEHEKTKGVVAFSSGNHAQGVALAARMLGIPATIIMPVDAPALKLQATKGYGAQVITYDRFHENREAIAAKIALETGAIIVPSFEDADIIAGQGTVGLEIAEDLNALGLAPDQMLINCGGGGLASGSFLAMKDAFGTLQGYTVEPDHYDDTMRSLMSGQIEKADVSIPSICDAIMTPSPGRMPFEILQALGVGGVTVSDDAALKAVAFASRHLKLVGEPGGVVSLAAVLTGKVETKDKVTVCIISGGNIDPLMLANAIRNFGGILDKAF